MFVVVDHFVPLRLVLPIRQFSSYSENKFVFTEGQPTPPPVDPCYPNFQCVKDGVCIARRLVCDFTPDCPGGTDEASDLCGYPCNFENGYCGYRNLLSDDYDWQRHSQGTPSAGTGPSTDASGNKTGSFFILT